jgi:hypothetical protein
MQQRYVRHAARALSIQRESFDNWLYFAGRSKGAFRPVGLRRDERRRWRPTDLARFFGKPDVLYFD